MVPVVFTDEGSESLLGAVTLEIFLLNVDPLRQRLVPTRGLLIALTEQPAAPSTAPPPVRVAAGENHGMSGEPVNL